MNSAAQMIAPLGAGQMDVGGGTPSPGLFNAIQRGIPVRIVADKGRHARGRAFEGLVVRPELVERGTFRDVADLKGRPVAISSQGSTGEIVLDTALKRVGLSSNDLELANLAFPDMPSALAGGSVDAAMVIEPFLATVLDKNFGVLWKRTDEIIPDFQAAVVLYGPQFVVGKPDVARRFMLAYVKASRYYNDAIREKGSPAWNEVVDILIKNTRIKDRAVYDQMGLPGLDPDASLNVDSIRDMQDWWLERGLQDERIDLSRAIDQSFAQNAARELGPYRQ
jgi:NitT/TauT family transport system substrate-binding protein